MSISGYYFFLSQFRARFFLYFIPWFLFDHICPRDGLSISYPIFLVQLGIIQYTILNCLPIVQTTIGLEFAIGLDRLPASKFLLLLTTPLVDTLLKRPIGSLRLWLQTIWLGRELHGGMEKIQDDFTINGPLRNWLRLSLL